jgi:hypothetical protein
MEFTVQESKGTAWILDNVVLQIWEVREPIYQTEVINVHSLVTQKLPSISDLFSQLIRHEHFESSTGLLRSKILIHSDTFLSRTYIL